MIKTEPKLYIDGKMERGKGIIIKRPLLAFYFRNILIWFLHLSKHNRKARNKIHANMGLRIYSIREDFPTTSNTAMKN